MQLHLPLFWIKIFCHITFFLVKMFSEKCNLFMFINVYLIYVYLKININYWKFRQKAEQKLGLSNYSYFQSDSLQSSSGLILINCYNCRKQTHISEDNHGVMVQMRRTGLPVEGEWVRWDMRLPELWRLASMLRLFLTASRERRLVRGARLGMLCLNSAVITHTQQFHQHHNYQQSLWLTYSLHFPIQKQNKQDTFTLSKL